MRAKVALVKCSTYNFPDIVSAIERTFSELGGLHRFIRPGQTVLLKPNLLSDHRPDQAITTHPEVVRALIRLVKQYGAIPVVADSAAGSMNIERVWERTGFRALCADESVPLLNLEKAGSQRFEVKGVSFSVAKPVLDADVVINVPKLKTHILTVLTNAVKNIYGTIPGYQKTMLHKQFPDPISFGHLLASVYTIVRPSLTVCDAIVAMEGNGPSAGSPVPYRFLAGSDDGVALDAIICHLLRIHPDRVPYFSCLKKAGVGETQWQGIDIVGDPPAHLMLRPLRLPNVFIGKVAPDWLYRRLGPYLWIRPVITDQCVGCGLCVKSCPVSALSLEWRGARHEKGKRPILNETLCIQCCCCHEVCAAQAIELRQSLLLRLVHSRSALKNYLGRFIK